MRYERKFRIEGVSEALVQQVVRLNPASFQVAFPDRWVNSIYLDNSTSNALRDNLAGISNRTKYRVRWYGEDLCLAHKPNLEEKIKQNMLGSKNVSPLPNFQINNDFNLSAYLQQNTNLPSDMRPVVLVRYRRAYFLSMDGQVRATIDRHVQYFPFQGSRMPLLSPLEDPAIILEIKHDEHTSEDRLNAMYQGIPFRITKNSKFVEAAMSRWF